MKKALLILLIATAFSSCSKSNADETCKTCYVWEDRIDPATGKQAVTETDAGKKCGDDIDKWTSKPVVQSGTYIKAYKCK